MTTNQSHSNEPVHTFGCALPTRGAACDCGAVVYQRSEFAAELARAMSRGFDYSQLIGGVAEGIHDEEGDNE